MKDSKTSRPLLIALAVLLLAGAALLLMRMPLYARETKTAPAETPAPSAPAAVPAETGATPEPPVSSPASPAPTEEPAATPEPEYFTVSMVGDCTLSASVDKVAWGIGYQLTVGDNYAYPFANTVELLNDDYLTVANLECDLSDSHYTSPTYEQFTFLSKAAYANILTEGSVEFVTTANNHVMDFGEAAYKDTCAALDAVGVAYAGEDETYIYEADGGVKIGLYCLYNQLTGNAMKTMSDAAQTALVENSKKMIDASVASLKEQGAEFFLICLHMGTEGFYEPTDVQLDICRYAIDAGYQAVYCTHAHRLQPAELYNGGIIFYGLGNWTFGGHTNPGNGTDPGSFDTGIAKITIKRVGSEATLDSYSFIPCCIASNVTFPLNGYSVNNYQPTPYEEGSDAYNRAMSMISGTYEGANYDVGNYWDILSAMNG